MYMPVGATFIICSLFLSYLAAPLSKEHLLKPINGEDLQKSVQKAAQRSQHILPQQLEVLLQKLKRPAVPITKLPIPTMEGFQLVPVESIISCKAESNYTFIFSKNKQKIIASVC